MGILNTLITKMKALVTTSACIAVAVMLLAPIASHSAPFTISQTPLFLQQRVQPNIMLLLDDSSSMDEEVLLSSSAGCEYNCYLDFTPRSNVDKKLKLCPGYNKLMYDPSKTYTPWVGKDRHGNTYQNSNVLAAQENPFLASTNRNCSAGRNFPHHNNRSCNLTSDMGPDGRGAYYYPWIDENSNGEYDDGECSTDDASRVWVSRLDANSSDGNNNSQQNFANWFSYYRKREYVMKRALSEIISESQERVGMATINQSTLLTDASRDASEEVGLEVANIDDISIPIDPAAVTNKQRLLRNLFRVTSAGSTPLRKGLVNVGRYFETGNSVGEDLFGFTPTNGSPILPASEGGECQQNFAIALSDGHWNGPTPNIGNADGNSTNLYDGQSYADGYSNTLADVAMHYYKRDLDGTLPNKVPSIPLFPGDSKDDNPAQHLVTFTVAFGLSGAIPVEDSQPCYPANRETFVEDQSWPEVCTDEESAEAGSGWPEPLENEATIDDMLHAAWNGRGKFLSATNPQSLIIKLQEAISDIAARTETTTAAAAIAVNSTNMRSGGHIYQAGFNPSTWSGQLFAYDLIGNQLIGPLWEAHTLLSNRATSRVLLTHNGTAGITFEFPDDYQNLNIDNDLHPDQVRDLLTNAPHDFDTADDDEAEENQEFGESIVEYFAGDSSNEGNSAGDFRPRSGNKLADIIDSAPTHVGNPSPVTYPDNIEGSDHSYQAWAATVSRDPMIYVGTNGGSLHGFNADTGNEIFAYFPKSLFSDATTAGLHWLADQSYTHRYYVDLTPSVSDVFINNEWRTILVSGLRAGGKALFALDITDPAALANQDSAPSKVLWEFTHQHLGHTFSRPTLARLNNGQWAAIFGNGYNNGPDGDGKSRLFIVDLSNGALIKSIETGVGSIANNDCGDIDSQCNGLSTPAVVDLNGDGIADRAYAGDLAGNLWTFDLSSSSPAAWGVAYNGRPLFTARSGPNSPQPITTRPAVALHPSQKGLSTAPNTMVFFGTGRYIDNNDIDNTTTQSFYGIWDSGNSVANNRLDLVQQTITESTVSINSTSFNVRTMSNNAVNYPTARGWFVDFDTTPKERIVVNPIIFGQLVLFTTTIPDQNLCGIAGGSWLMALDSNSGGEPNFTALDINSDGLFSEEDMVNDHNLSGLQSGDLYWQPTIVETGHGGSGTLLLPKDNESNIDNNQRLDQIDIQGALPSKARSSWSRFNF